MPPAVEILRGGAPVKNTILVNVDDETITGDGSRDRPLTAIGSGVVTVDRLEATDGESTLDPDTTVTFVAWGGGDVAVDADLVLPDPTDPDNDGQQKQVILASPGVSNVRWRIEPASFVTTRITFTTGEAGGALLVWSATSAMWFCVGTFIPT